MATRVAPIVKPELDRSKSSSLTFSRTWLAEVAKENQELAKNGYYINSKGEKVDVSKSLKESIKGTKHYHHSKKISAPKEINQCETKMYVCYSLIIKAALALKRAGAKHVGVLNSADGFLPGGKFGTGCLSLEACICRGSLLHPCLEAFKNKNGTMYQVNNKEFNGDSPSSCAIYSPDVPVIRTDALEALLLDKHEECSFVSIPPPNAFVLGSEEEVRSNLKLHITRALYIFAENGCTDLALCSFGCGTRGNDPMMLAEIYHEVLTNELNGYFNRVVFAINPRKNEEYEAFSTKFQERAKI